MLHVIAVYLLGKDHFEECVSFVKEHRLYAEALELYEHNSEQYQVGIILTYLTFLLPKCSVL